jgi:hypothetical protein
MAPEVIVTTPQVVVTKIKDWKPEVADSNVDVIEMKAA